MIGFETETKPKRIQQMQSNIDPALLEDTANIMLAEMRKGGRIHPYKHRSFFLSLGLTKQYKEFAEALIKVSGKERELVQYLANHLKLYVVCRADINIPEYRLWSNNRGHAAGIVPSTCPAALKGGVSFIFSKNVVVCYFMQHHKFEQKDHDKIYINEEIRFPEVRVVSDNGNLGVMSSTDALKEAREQGLDLIVVSAKANPPVAKIIDYGKFTYEQKKKNREVKKNSFVAETKTVQVKIGTGDRDKRLKVERIERWMMQGHRVKVDLFLWGRYKYMEAPFLTERLQRFLDMVRVPFKLAEPIQKTPKGFGCTIERDKAQPVPELKKLTGKHAEKEGASEDTDEIEEEMLDTEETETTQ